MPRKPDDTFGPRLRSLREARGLTQYALGKRVGMRQGHIARLEAGERVPSLETASRLAQGLEVSLAEFDGLYPLTRSNTIKRRSRKGGKASS